MACRAEGKQKGFMSTVVNRHGELVLATKFIKPVAPPPEVVYLDAEEDRRSLVSLVNEQHTDTQKRTKLILYGH